MTFVGENLQQTKRWMLNDETVGCCGPRCGGSIWRNSILRGYGFYDVGADTPHWEITRRVMETVRNRSIAVRAGRIELPDLQDEQLVLKGAGQYAAMCVNCHLAPEQSDSEIRPGLYPKPPNLSEQRFDPKTVFWVTKHGLKMSGMRRGVSDMTMRPSGASSHSSPSCPAYLPSTTRTWSRGRLRTKRWSSMDKGDGKKPENNGKKPGAGMSMPTEQKGEHKH